MNATLNLFIQLRLLYKFGYGFTNPNQANGTPTIRGIVRRDL